jgi:aminoglycoside phosphotransferase (APT) family kinase protein
VSDLDYQAVAVRVRDVLAATWPDVQVGELSALEGGHSGLTLAGDVRDADMDRVVVKVAPQGRKPVGRHDVLRQGRLLSALGGRDGVSVPVIHGMDPADPPIVVMEFVEGETVEPILDAPDVTLPADIVTGRARAAARMLAHLHLLDPSEVAPGEPVTTWLDERERWVPTMATVDPTLTSRAGELLDLLRSVDPAPVRPAVLHGDFRLGNTLCLDWQVSAIIDWEIWSVGDPRVDLGWFRVFTDHVHLPNASAPAPGMPDAATLMAEYESVTGVPLPDLAWFDALARYKMAAIMGNNLQRHREGRYHDPYQERLPPSIRSLIDQGIELLAA